MNYYEYRLKEISDAIPVLSEKKDCLELVKSLKEERKRILDELRYDK